MAELLTEADLAEPVPTRDETMDFDEWWREFFANQCCPSARAAADNLCGCGGGPTLTGVSRLLTEDIA